MFDALRNLKDLQVLSSLSEDGLLKMLQSIPLPVRIVSIYSQGARHYAWFQTEARIKKQVSKVQTIEAGNDA